MNQVWSIQSQLQSVAPQHNSWFILSSISLMTSYPSKMFVHLRSKVRIDEAKISFMQLAYIELANNIIHIPAIVHNYLQ